MEQETILTGYPSIDKPWLKYYSKEAIYAPIPEKSIYDFLWENNRDCLRSVALIYFGLKITYGKLFKEIDKCEKALRNIGVKKGDIVCMNLPSTPECVYLFYACSKIGAVANVLDPRLDVDELHNFLIEAKSEVLIFFERCLPIVEKAVKETNIRTLIEVSATESIPILSLKGHQQKEKRNSNYIVWKKFIKAGKECVSIEQELLKQSELPLLMIHTSGTTGGPKGVVLSNRNVNSVAHQYQVAIPHERGQKYLCMIPPFIAFGLCIAVHMPITLGVTVVLIPQFEPEKFGSLLKKYKPEHMVCPPSNWDALMKQNDPTLDLSFILTPATGGDGMDIAYEHKLNQFLVEHGCDRRVLKGYGMTEVSSSSCTCWENCNADGSVGIPLVNMTLSVFEIGTTRELSYMEEGEICFTGPNVMQGYYEKETETAAVLKMHEDGQIWMHSGDVGYMTEDGFLYVIDRINRRISKAGHMIFPSKTEKVVMEHSEVKKCIVIGGKEETVVAFIVVGEKVDEPKLIEELKRMCQEHLPQYACPDLYILKDTMPLTPVGKIDYRKLESEVK